MEREDQGFSLIELMVVVLVIAILLAVAIPAFLGARSRANDRAAQSNVRNANTNALIFYTDHQQFTSDINELAAVDASLGYTNTLSFTNPRTVFVDVPAGGTYSPKDTVFLAVKSTNGQCFWIRVVGDKSDPRFAKNDCSSVPPPSAFAEQW